MNRREFLEAAALTAALPSRSWAAGEKVNVAIVGVGGRGSSHVGDFVRRQDANLAAVCDVDTARTERAVQTHYSARNTKPKVYGDPQKIIRGQRHRRGDHRDSQSLARAGHNLGVSGR